MENKKNYKNHSSSNLEQIKPKLIKRDIKIISNKKENIIPSAFNINKEIKKNNLSQNINESNSKNKNKKIIFKGREIQSSRENRILNRPKQRKRKFKNIDEIVLLIQKHIRKYLKRIHNDPKLQMIKMLKEKKKNLFENYKIEKNPSLINEFKREQIEKNKNDENINSENQDNFEKISNLNSENNRDEFNEQNQDIENKNIIKYIIKKSDKLNEDLEGLEDKYIDISSIDEDIIQNYIEEPKEINLENNINKMKKKRRKVNNNIKFELVIEKKNNNIDNNKDIKPNEIDIIASQKMKEQKGINTNDNKKMNNIIIENIEEIEKNNTSGDKEISNEEIKKSNESNIKNKEIKEATLNIKNYQEIEEEKKYSILNDSSANKNEKI